jgi:hypothetical protein
MITIKTTRHPQERAFLEWQTNPNNHLMIIDLIFWLLWKQKEERKKKKKKN